MKDRIAALTERARALPGDDSRRVLALGRLRDAGAALDEAEHLVRAAAADLDDREEDYASRLTVTGGAPPRRRGSWRQSSGVRRRAQ